MGISGGTLQSLITSLFMLPRLHRLIFSSPLTSQPFFESSVIWKECARSFRNLGRTKDDFDTLQYAPRSFEECATDLANGCRTLDTITMCAHDVGDLLIKFHDDKSVSARVEREFAGGPVRKVRKARAWGRTVGREEEW
ncbi:hypothetical protein CPB84DRAFT_1773292 [Gymnopilus junonius]|uniref:Uncharacterized protein n=1 Tax=Gymnopilus junonius TaxID=109634 RepID=A0A9P5NPI2_GYMJU|nr:hypothetical protein CPB84DRAFT_1773292 [Gymnopilus junonius]